MLKGIRGLTNRDVHRVPVIDNTPARVGADLVDRGRAARSALCSSYAILVRDHGAYIWGADIWEAKRHTEVYHFLFEAVLARSTRPAAAAKEAPR